MNEHEKQAEIYRDPQIDELIEALRILQNDLCDLRWTLYSGFAKNAQAVESLNSDLRRSFHELIMTMLHTAFVPWYLRVWRGLRLMRENAQLGKLAEAQKERDEKRRLHMQRLAENAGKLQGRFRSRFN
jgi:hypothetical protein